MLKLYRVYLKDGRVFLVRAVDRKWATCAFDGVKFVRTVKRKVR